MSTRKICAITGNRSEYGLLFPVLKAIKSHKKLSLQLIATTSHLSKAFGSTFTEIESDGFQIDEKIDNTKKHGGHNKQTILLTIKCFKSLIYIANDPTNNINALKNIIMNVQ